MVTITDKAVEKVKTILDAEGKSSWGLRIYNAGKGCCGPSYGLDINETPLADDETIEQNGLKIFVDKKIAAGLSGMKLDYYDDGEQAGFLFTGGSASSCCPGSSSCGETC